MHSQSTAHSCGKQDPSLLPPARFRGRASCSTGPAYQQYSAASTYYVRVNNDNGALRSELRVKITAGVNDDTLSATLCADLFAVGSVVAGLFTGGALAAAGLSLASLACGAL